MALGYAGPGSLLTLTELVSGATPAVRVSEMRANRLTIDLGAGHTFDASSTISAAGLVYSSGSAATSQSATIDVSKANSISTLQANLTGDALDLGGIADAFGGLGAITASAAGINVASVSTGAISLKAGGGAEAGALTITGAVHARTLSLTASGQIEIGPQADVAAQAGGLGGQVRISAPVVLLDGDISADGAQGGTVSVQGDAVIQAGAVTADGTTGPSGAIAIAFGRNYVATAAARLNADGAGRSGECDGKRPTVQQRQHDGRRRPGRTGDADRPGHRAGCGNAGRLGNEGRRQHCPWRCAASSNGDADRNGDGGNGHSRRRHADRTGRRGAGLVESGDGFCRRRQRPRRRAEWSGRPDRGFQRRRGKLQRPGQRLGGARPGGSVAAGPEGPRDLGRGDSASAVPTDQPGTGTAFGNTILPLSTGDVVVVNATDSTVASNAGAVYLFNSQTGALIGMLTGSNSSDFVGGSGVTALSNGNYVIDSPSWSDDTGAVTEVSSGTGNALDGTTVVSASNSLVGASSGDQVGSSSVTALGNGNYVIDSQSWNGSSGAVTLVSGVTGLPLVGNSTAVSSSNSLVGSTAGDDVGDRGVTVLSNGNYVVDSPNWDSNMGAATLVSGVTGLPLMGNSTAVSSSNSLVGSTADDAVGVGGVTVLSSGNYVVDSWGWSSDTGAVTLVSGSTGAALDGTNAVSSSNSLVGNGEDAVGRGGVTALSNGNYVVDSYAWSNGAGAVTEVSGSTGKALDGESNVSSSNSLVGSTAGDSVGIDGVTVLSSGNYVIDSPDWSGETGAVTLVSSGTGLPLHGTSAVSAVNSLVGRASGDEVGNIGVTPLSNGNYVVNSPFWSSDTGAVTEVSARHGSGPGRHICRLRLQQRCRQHHE